MGTRLRTPPVDTRIKQLKKQRKVTGGKAPALPPGVTVKRKAKASTRVRAAPLPPGVPPQRKKTKAELKMDAKIVKHNKSLS
jgi:hypothetical protein